MLPEIWTFGAFGTHSEFVFWDDRFQVRLPMSEDMGAVGARRRISGDMGAFSGDQWSWLPEIWAFGAFGTHSQFVFCGNRFQARLPMSEDMGAVGAGRRISGDMGPSVVINDQRFQRYGRSALSVPIRNCCSAVTVFKRVSQCRRTWAP